MSEEITERRLSRIEEKIDRLSDAMIAIARTEEKLLAMEQKYSAQYDRMNKFSEKLDAIDKKVDKDAQVVSNISKLSWIVAGALVTAIVTAVTANYYNVI